jgi:hypothetical protein
MGVDPIGIDGESRTAFVTLCGDLNHGEPLSTMDMVLALQMAANNIDIDFAADVNSDGAVTQVNYEVPRSPFSEVSSVLN